jgi:hypothetical protein
LLWKIWIRRDCHRFQARQPGCHVVRENIEVHHFDIPSPQTMTLPSPPALHHSLLLLQTATALTTSFFPLPVPAVCRNCPSTLPSTRCQANMLPSSEPERTTLSLIPKAERILYSVFLYWDDLYDWRSFPFCRSKRRRVESRVEIRRESPWMVGIRDVTESVLVSVCFPA